MPTPLRTVRVPDSRWGRALSIAKRRQESLSAVINEALDAYIAEHDSSYAASDSSRQSEQTL